MTFTSNEIYFLLFFMVGIPNITNAVVQIIAAVKGNATQDAALAAQTQAAAAQADQLGVLNRQVQLHERQINVLANRLPAGEPPQGTQP